MEKTETAEEYLASLAREYWEERISNEPIFATALGDRRFDDRLPDISPEGRERIRQQYQSIVYRCGRISNGTLGAEEMLTKAALFVDASSVLQYYSCNLEDWVVDPLQGVQVELMNVESYQPVRTVEEGRMMVKRWQAIGPLVDQHIANLRAGASANKVAVGAAVEKVIDELNDLAVKPDSQWPLLRPLSVEHDDWTEEERKEFREGLESAVHDSACPGFTSYLEFLKSEILPKARPQEKPGFMHIPGGN